MQVPHAIHPILKSLPNNALLGLKEIGGYTGVCKNTLNSRLRAKIIPLPPIRSGFRGHESKPRLYWSAGFVRDNLGLFSK